jgi:L-idonate 5-dehydrogenase
MRALVVHGADDLRIDTVVDPVLAVGEVLVAMEWGGICGSDLTYWKKGASGTAVLKHPLVLGHEIAGHIVGLGAEVTGLTVGDAVTVHPSQPVGDDPLPERLAGRTNLYPEIRYFGSAAFDPHTDGGFSELRAVPAGMIRVLPDGVDTLHGALAEPFAVALHAVSRAGDIRGRDVLVNGAGPIGSLVVAAAIHRGAASVTAVDIQDSALAVARALGAKTTLNVAAGDSLPVDAEIVFETSGAAGVLGSVLHATARGGTVIQVGNLPGTPTPAAIGDLVTREITWIGSYRFVDEIDDALEAMAAGLDLSAVVTHRFDLADAHEAMRVAADRSTGSSKVMLRLSDSQPTARTDSSHL